MFYLKKFVCVLLITLQSFPLTSNHSESTAHIFGDSHAYFTFRKSFKRNLSITTLLTDKTNSGHISIPAAIHHLGPITMHRVGRDGLKFLNLKDYGVQENDIVIFVFGEIDVRCHIGKQRDVYQKNLDDIVDTLVTNYINTILDNKKMFNNLTCIVCCVLPPTDRGNNPDFPFYGALADRVAITKKLNNKLTSTCQIAGLHVLDAYESYSTAQGNLKNDLSDGCVHINPEYNYLAKEKLYNILMGIPY